jgi:hypothetical protein
MQDTCDCQRVLVPIAAPAKLATTNVMAKSPAGNPATHPAEWARRCRIEAARAIHPMTKAFLLDLAGKYEAIAGEPVNLDPDDIDLQNAVADRLAELAARRNEEAR